MLKYEQVIEVHGRMFGGARVVDRYRLEDGTCTEDEYECADEDELRLVLDALDVLELHPIRPSTFDGGRRPRPRPARAQGR